MANMKALLWMKNPTAQMAMPMSYGHALHTPPHAYAHTHRKAPDLCFMDVLICTWT